MPGLGSRKRVHLKKLSAEGVTQAKVAAVFTAGLKEAKNLFDVGLLSLRQYGEYQTFLNQAYGDYFRAAGKGDATQIKRLLSAISKYKKEQLSISTSSTNGQRAKVSWKKREGINNEVDYKKALTAKKKSLKKTRIFRRFINGQSMIEIAIETGVTISTVRTYIIAEAERRKLDYSTLLKENKAHARANPPKSGPATSKKEKTRPKATSVHRGISSKGVYAEPTVAGLKLAGSRALEFTAQINAIEVKPGLDPASKAPLVKDEVDALKRRRQILTDYMLGKLPADHEIAMLLNSIGKKRK